MNQIYAILLAGGVGSRMGEATPKQFLEFKGKSLLEHSVERFKQWGLCKALVVVSHKDWILKTETLLSSVLDADDRIVEGGDTRHLSVLNGLGCLTLHDTDLVFIHDVARPNFSLDELYLLVEKTKIFGAASLVSKATESLVYVKLHTNYTEEPLDRNEVFIVKTPQMVAGFMVKELSKEMLPQDLNLHPTDLCTWMGERRVGIILTDHKNVKITNPGDITIAEQLS
ncbi:IspD/TarI family cytidylyltransferase [Leptospira sp. 96542]|nr:IspD/TarI family cytidylyltransferase [Leptospira sp. 96542]